MAHDFFKSKITINGTFLQCWSVFTVSESWQKLEWEWEWKEKGKGIALFALNVHLHGCDLLDNHIGRLHNNF